jgi:hypothetical protein
MNDLIPVAAESFAQYGLPGVVAVFLVGALMLGWRAIGRGVEMQVRVGQPRKRSSSRRRN